MIQWYIAAAYDRFAAVSRASRDAAAAAEIRFIHDTYAVPKAVAFARRNADRVTSLGDYVAPDFASIRMYSQLRHLELDLERDRGEIALLPRSLTKLDVSLHTWSIDWENFRPLGCLQELQITSLHKWSYVEVQLDDSFATALPLLRVFRVFPGLDCRRGVALETTAKVDMPHLIELTIASRVQIVHLDLHFICALKRLILDNCIVSTVSAGCSIMVLYSCWRREGMVVVTPNLRSLIIYIYIYIYIYI